MDSPEEFEDLLETLQPSAADDTDEMPRLFHQATIAREKKEEITRLAQKKSRELAEKASGHCGVGRSGPNDGRYGRIRAEVGVQPQNFWRANSGAVNSAVRVRCGELVAGWFQNICQKGSTRSVNKENPPFPEPDPEREE